MRRPPPTPASAPQPGCSPGCTPPYPTYSKEWVPYAEGPGVPGRNALRAGTRESGFPRAPSFAVGHS